MLTCKNFLQFPAYHPSAFDGSSERTIQNEMIPVKGGDVQMGKPHDWWKLSQVSLFHLLHESTIA